MCMNCQAQYCKSCQENWSKKSKSCTNRCTNTKYEKSILAQGLLSKLQFICKKCENDFQLKVLTEAQNNIKDELESVKSM